MYRKTERLDKSYAKEPLLAFLKAILVERMIKSKSCMSLPQQTIARSAKMRCREENLPPSDAIKTQRLNAQILFLLVIYLSIILTDRNKLSVILSEVF